MIDALVQGRLLCKPERRTASNGSSFVTAKLRTPMANGETVFINVITFSQSVGAVLLNLDDGDSTALAGELKIATYTARDGTARPSVDLVAHAALSEYHIQRKRRAVGEAVE